VNTFGGYPLIDPSGVRANRDRFQRDLIPELDRANAYYSMAGRWPDVGWLLISRASYNQLNPYSNNLQLVLADFINPPLVVSNVSIVQARCVTRGVNKDPNAVYLLQVTNNEGVIYNPWFQYPVNAQYNVRAPAYDGGYYSGSLNSGVPWTWDGMVGNLWAKASGLLGTYPHLPTAPTGTPENFIFVGVPLWEAINRIMDYLGLDISGNYPNFTIVAPGTADPSYSLMTLKYAGNLQDSMEYLDMGSGRVPSQVVVYFHARYQYYGTEETVRNDAWQWQNQPTYQATVPAPSQFSNAVGTGYIWVDFTVRLDVDGNPLPADVVAAATIAAERVGQFFNTIYRGTQGFLRHVYAGLLPFTTGSMVDGVRWFQTGDGKGWRTEVIRGYIWPEATFPLTVKGLTGPE
jgi:hypothetical protein